MAPHGYERAAPGHLGGRFRVPRPCSGTAHRRPRPRVTGRASVGRLVHSPCPATRPGTPVELRIIVDNSIAEIYLAEEQVLTLRFYPVADGPWRLQARTTSTGRGDFAVKAWNLESGGVRQGAVPAGHRRDA
ncbi:GH32 C-terminal domain-containing protein [Streptomyces sp. NPDC060209]|uniref:GH32 C-terminal domain-containing protein n=1 Tax=Streptomyces sp. NPDC060209 TaxID=3347073 RepID=UPI0036595D6F